MKIVLSEREKSNPFSLFTFFAFSISKLILFNLIFNLHKNVTNINKDSQSNIRILQHQSGGGILLL